MFHPEIQAAQTRLQPLWQSFDAVCQQAFNRILQGMINARVSEACFASVSGYGHNDVGREAMDDVFAHAFEAEAALVRPQIVSGTHAISIALNGCLRAGDTLLSITGAPYDTLEPVIGINLPEGEAPAPRSLVGQGVRYQEINLLRPASQDSQASQDVDALHGWRLNTDLSPEDVAQLKNARVVLIQRSRGYSARPALLIEEIRELCALVKTHQPNAVIFVDNCYGEFIAEHEPCAVGADLIAGSLIKNPGGGIVPAGGYIAGKREWVEKAADVLTCPGIGSEGGYTFHQTRLILQGLFLAPGVVKEALMGMSLLAAVFEAQGYETAPKVEAKRGDIIQAIRLGSPETMLALCKQIQAASPVNAYLTPEAAKFPGYQHPVVMAGGTFIDGSSIELSADGPLRPPYTLYAQGGLTVSHVRYMLEAFLSDSGLKQA
ncbi:MAG: methionine gamma-lyase family protein [Vampirovibrionales bacterium]|nr:methionine gamma-lyase family protein [Vampirovibrionales bacterium]